MKKKELLLSVANKITTPLPSKACLVGFDGFIDEIIEVVDERVSSKTYTRIDSIKNFSERVAQASNLSANIELVPKQIKLGGNGPIMANALLTLGATINYVGALGKKHIHPVFSDFALKCNRVVSLTEPAFTHALEFSDGKLMLGKMQHLDEVNWNAIKEVLSEKEIEDIITSAKLIAFDNWTMLPQMNTIMFGIHDVLKKTKHNPYIFIDLADPAKRISADIREVLELIQKLSTVGKVIFSMNKNESLLIANVLNIKELDILRRTKKIQEILDVENIVVHPIEGACVASENQTVWVDGPYTPNPKITTGAGDNFNAGFCTGIINGLSLEKCLITGVYTSGYYVRNCHSPNINELSEFLKAMAL